MFEQLHDYTGCEITFISARSQDHQHKETCYQVRLLTPKRLPSTTLVSRQVDVKTTSTTDDFIKSSENISFPKGISRSIVGTPSKSRSHIYQHILLTLTNVVQWFSMPCSRLKTNRYKRPHIHRHS